MKVAFFVSFGRCYSHLPFLPEIKQEKPSQVKLQVDYCVQKEKEKRMEKRKKREKKGVLLVFPFYLISLRSHWYVMSSFKLIIKLIISKQLC